MPTFPSQVPTGVSYIPFGSGNQNFGSTSNYFGTVFATQIKQTGTAAGGGVAGPGSTTSSGIAIWNGTGGTTLADSTFAIVADNLVPAVSGTQTIGALATPVRGIAVSGINGSAQAASVVCTWNNNTGTPTASGTYNVASLTDVGVGVTTVVFTNALKDNKYAVVANCSYLAATTILTPMLLMTTGCKLTSVVAVGNVATDEKNNSVAIWSQP